MKVAVTIPPKWRWFAFLPAVLVVVALGVWGSCVAAHQKVVAQEQRDRIERLLHSMQAEATAQRSRIEERLDLLLKRLEERTKKH